MGKTRVLTEAALTLAIFIVLLFITVYVPYLSIIVQFFLILPFLYFSSKHSLKYSIILLIAAHLISFVLTSLAGLSFAFLYGIAGIVMGYLIQKKESKENILIVSSLVFLFALVVEFALASLFFNFNFIQQYEEVARSTVTHYINTLEEFGQTLPMNIEEQLWNIIDTIISLVPTFLVATVFTITLIIMAINFPIIKRLGMSVPKFQPFRTLNFPKGILWLYLLVIVLTMTVTNESSSFWYMAILNANLILQALLIIQGLAFIFYFSYQKKWPKVVPILAIVLSFIMPFFLLFVRVLGIIDIGFDLRQRLNAK